MWFVWCIGDQTILKKVLLSVPTTQRSNQTVIYEYSATKAVSCIEYLVENLTDEVTRPPKSIFIFISNTSSPGKRRGRHRLHRRILACGQIPFVQHPRDGDRHVDLRLWQFQCAAALSADSGAAVSACPGQCVAQIRPGLPAAAGRADLFRHSIDGQNEGCAEPFVGVRRNGGALHNLCVVFGGCECSKIWYTIVHIKSDYVVCFVIAIV